MELEGSLPHSQEPATCPYPEPARSSPCPPHPTSWRSILILSFHLRLVPPSGSFPQVSQPKHCIRLSSPIRATCPGHLILLDLTTQTILVEENRLRQANVLVYFSSAANVQTCKLSFVGRHGPSDGLVTCCFFLYPEVSFAGIVATNGLTASFGGLRCWRGRK